MWFIIVSFILWTIGAVFPWGSADIYAIWGFFLYFVFPPVMLQDLTHLDRKEILSCLPIVLFGTLNYAYIVLLALLLFLGASNIFLKYAWMCQIVLACFLFFWMLRTVEFRIPLYLWVLSQITMVFVLL